MKKFLILLSCFIFLGSSASTLVSCKKINNENNNENNNEKDKSSIIAKFKERINEVFNKHNKDLSKKFCDTKKTWSFLNEKNIKKYDNSTLDKLEPNDKKLFENDVQYILEIDKLKQKINEIINNKEFDPITKDIKKDEILKIDISYNESCFICNNDPNKKNVIGEIKISYFVEYKYINNEDKEENNNLTKNLEFEFQKCSVDEEIRNFVSKIGKDFILSNKSYVNWEEIKGNKNECEGFGNAAIDQFQTKNLASYKARFLEFINKESKKYFGDSKFIDDNISFSYNQSPFNVNFINVFENKSSNDFETFADSKWRWEVFDAFFRDNKSNLQYLQNRYFTNKNLEKWNNEFLQLKNDYLKNEKFNQNEISEITKLSKYKNADSIGKLNVKGLKIRKGCHECDVEIPDFSLYFTYNVVNADNKNDNEIYNKKSALLAKFSLDYLIKIFQESLDMNDTYPSFNADIKDNWLFTIRVKQYIDELKKIDTSSKNLYTLFSKLNSFPGFQEKVLSNIDKLLKNKNNGYVIWGNFDKAKYPNSFLKFTDWKSIDSNYNSDISCVFDSKKNSIVILRVDNSDEYPRDVFLTFKLGYLAINIDYNILVNVEKKAIRDFIKFK